MRRTGKTTLLNYIYDQVDSKNKLFLDLENPLNRKYFEDARDITQPMFETIAPLYEEYILFGGFPGVVVKDFFRHGILLKHLGLLIPGN